MKVKINEFKLIRLIYFLSLTSIFIGGRNFFSIGNLDLNLFDISFIFIIIVLFFKVIHNHKLLISTFSPKLLVFVLLYFILVIGLPLLGVLIYNYPIHYIYESFKWFQFVLLLILGLVIYNDINYKKEYFFYDFIKVLKISILFQFFIFIFQFAHQYGIISNSLILDFWFDGGTVGYGKYGYHIYRFSGASMGPSGLGIISSMSIGVLLYKILVRETLNTKFDYIYLSLSIILLIASGVRTSVIAVVFIGVFLLINIFKNNLIDKSKFMYIFNFLIVVFLFLFYNVRNIKLGRIGSSKRFSKLIKLLTGDLTLQESSKRVGRWIIGFEMFFDKYSAVFGTLASPSWVLNDVVLDSYYVLSFIQGGFFLITVFILLLLFNFITLFKYKNTNNQIYFLGIICLIIIIINSMMQNFITGLMGRAMLTILITCSNLLYRKGSISNIKV